VTWLYASRGLVASGALTLGSIALFVLLALLAIVDRGRSRLASAPDACSVTFVDAEGGDATWKD
jgi:hypothetical protein